MSKPAAWKKSLAVSGNIIRIACLPDGMTTPGATFAVRHPETFMPAKSRAASGEIVLRHGGVTVRLRQDGKALSAKNLLVEWEIGGEAKSWKPGDKDHENLGGSYLGLDMLSESLCGEGVAPYDPMAGFDSHVVSPTHLVDAVRDAVRVAIMDPLDEKKWFPEFRRYIHGEKPQVLKSWPKAVRDAADRVRTIPPGMLSRSGLTVILDDSLPWNSAENWIGQRPSIQPQVLYLIPYGSDFKAGVARLTDLLGRAPRLPDWVLGTWFSCYRRMGEKQYHQLKKDFEKHGLPLDAVVVDTDWHRLFWHGFDWDTRLFPEPTRFRDWLRENRLHSAFNVHPAYIPRRDTRLPEFMERTGATPAITTKETAPTWFHEDCQPIDMFDRAHAEAYFDIFHRPIEKDGGCDMWWVDGTLKDNAGRDATAWLNEIYTLRGRPGRSAKPDLVLSRTHGLGAHRSTIHFTGDTVSQWRVLEQEVRLTPMAGNSLLAWVSHDIGGFFRNGEDDKLNKPPADLMVRWVQFGALSPIMRLHSDHGIREPWKFGKEALGIMRRFLLLRQELLPYFRALAREAHRTGVGPCRPMYYEFPGSAEAYRRPLQYMLGGEYLVSPVANPGGQKATWLPPGKWSHCFEERLVEGPCVIEERVPLASMPVYRLIDKA